MSRFVQHLIFLATKGYSDKLLERGSFTRGRSRYRTADYYGSWRDRKPYQKILARIIHDRLLQRPIPLPGAAFLIRSPRRTASTSASPSLARSRGGFRSQPLRDGIHE